MGCIGAASPKEAQDDWPIRIAFARLYDELCDSLRPRTLQAQIERLAARREPDEPRRNGAHSGNLVGLPGQLTAGGLPAAPAPGTAPCPNAVHLTDRVWGRPSSWPHAGTAFPEGDLGGIWPRCERPGCDTAR